MTAPPKSLRDRVIVDGSVGLAIALPLAAVFAYHAYAPILFIMAALSGTRGRHWKDGAKAIRPPIDWKNPYTVGTLAILAFCLWLALSSLWSPIPKAALLYFSVSGLVLAASLVVAEILSRSARDIRFLAATFLAGSLFALGLLFFEARSGGYLRHIVPPQDLSPDRFDDITQLGRGLTAFLPGLFPALAILLIYGLRATGARRWLVYAAIAIVVLVVFATAVDLTIAANSAAVLAGAGAAIAALFSPRRALQALIVLFLAALIFAPALALLPVEQIAASYGEVLPVSWLQRLFIWRHAALLAIDCLPIGCGIDYARAVFAEGATIDLPRSPIPLLLMPIHPHNGFLQIWLELGVPGVLFFAAFIVSGGVMLLRARLARPVAAGVVGAGAVILMLAFVDMGIWREWRLASIGVAAAGAALAHRLWVDGAGSTLQERRS
ncbi:MAG: hypothetical protein WD076_12060 [Parvularculaceae bacterium]